MGLYDFKPRFVNAILRGEKTHTIRAIRKHPDKPGKTMHLYTGLRTKKAKLLMRVPCVKVENIRIELCAATYDCVLTRGVFFPHVFIGETDLSWDELQSLAWRDGFADFADMMKFWDGRLPFEGHIIHWRYVSKKS